MFQVVYLFHVKAGRAQDFERAWKELTEAIYRNAGSLGSKLLKQDVQRYLALASWPNALAWEESASSMPGWSGAIKDRLLDCCESIETIFQGNTIEDLSRNSVFRPV